MSNFSFLKSKNEDLFNIIVEAECMFRDEYFEQTPVQVRRFAENICRDLLKDKALPDDTFDSMICKIKDNSFKNIRMKEFADDLYFIKKQGNNSAHSSSSSQNGKIALECLERAFEIAIFYSNVKFGYNKKLDEEVFSEEMLMTGKKTSENNFKKQYAKKLKQAKNETKKQESKKNSTKPKTVSKTCHVNSEVKTNLILMLSLIVLISILLLAFNFIK